jgi:hypothetical protein
MRPRLTYANVVASLALFVALGGSSYAALELANGSVKKKHLATNSVVSKKVKDASLLAQDFAPGQLPAGPRGPQGPAGSPDSPAGVLSKLKQVDGAGSGQDADLVDGRDSTSFLGANAKAADSSKLDGHSINQVVKGGGRIHSLTAEISPGAEREIGRTEDGFVTFQCRPPGYAGPRIQLYNYWEEFEGVFRKGTAAPSYFWHGPYDGAQETITLASSNYDQLTLQTTLRGKAATVTVSSVDWGSSCFVAMQMVSAE